MLFSGFDGVMSVLTAAWFSGGLELVAVTLGFELTVTAGAIAGALNVRFDDRLADKTELVAGLLEDDGAKADMLPSLLASTAVAMDTSLEACGSTVVDGRACIVVVKADACCCCCWANE